MGISHPFPAQVYDRLVYERPAKVLAPLGLALAALPTAVAVGLLRRGDAPFGSVHDAMYLWPPAQLCDFLLGVVSAELAATHAARPRWRLAAPGADASCLAVAALVLFAPNPGSRYRTGAEELFDHGLAPLFAGRETKICDTTSICMCSHGFDVLRSLSQQHSPREKDPSKNRSNRLRCDRAREV